MTGSDPPAARIRLRRAVCKQAGTWLPRHLAVGTFRVREASTEQPGKGMVPGPTKSGRPSSSARMAPSADSAASVKGIGTYGLAFGALIIVGGRLGDLFGRRRVFQLGLAIFTLSSLLSGLAQSPQWLIRRPRGVGGRRRADRPRRSGAAGYYRDRRGQP